MAGLVDTSVFIALERQGGHLAALDVATRGEPFALASITASELLVGVHRARSAARRRYRLDFLEAILRRVPVMSFDAAAAETHASLHVYLAAIGQPIGPNDLLIASTALTLGYELLTHNLSHFQRIPGLLVREPNWQQGS